MKHRFWSRRTLSPLLLTSLTSVSYKICAKNISGDKYPGRIRGNEYDVRRNLMSRSSDKNITHKTTASGKDSNWKEPELPAIRKPVGKPPKKAFVLYLYKSSFGKADASITE